MTHPSEGQTYSIAIVAHDEFIIVSRCAFLFFHGRLCTSYGHTPVPGTVLKYSMLPGTGVLYSL